MSRYRQSQDGRFIVAAAMLALCGVPVASADSPGEWQPHPQPSGMRMPRLSALAWAGVRAPLQAKHQVSLDQPRHGMLGPRESQLPTPSGDEEARFAVSFPVHWQKQPEIIRTARAFRRQGLPLVHLWQSESGEHVLAIGLNGHGVPGIYLTQKVPD